ncbi:transcription initiation factor TFIID subunit 12 isoform X2 [Molothrus ater]|uniref:transcription initiation factor TFIID subunit 12 isoform X2 n=2 Tax=Icteridae TaxID=164646 RepID=UPI00174D5E03|nr:transcription initiation factor TFIID subunit 12 isoform X2 [Molothrus ater]
MVTRGRAATANGRGRAEKGVAGATALRSPGGARVAADGRGCWRAAGRPRGRWCWSATASCSALWGCARPAHRMLIGLDPHNPKKKQDLDKLYDLKAKAQQIMNQFGPSALINLSNFSSIKPEPASTPPQSSMANSTTVAKMPGTPSGGGRLSPESNQMLLQIADDFIESVVTAACQLARHRKSNTLEVKDVQLHLERQWNMWIPGFGSEEIRPYKKACTTEAHKQRMALIRKTTKK